jgi:hypothetical protein
LAAQLGNLAALLGNEGALSLDEGFVQAWWSEAGPLEVGEEGVCGLVIAVKRVGLVVGGEERAE